ncbi:MAG: hypothetical protein JNM93_11135 [Bacteriovoracaceae bacterium]|nr:hypothetical protein [Bacteriovoracaceae bacterium]
MIKKLIVLVCYFSMTQVWGQYTFGFRGDAGWRGSSGYSGEDGTSQVIRADGRSAFFDLSGGDGDDGRDGRDGENAIQCFQPFQHFGNLIGAEGGDGGDGGTGGRGGDGGNVLIYFQDWNDLKAIALKNEGGRGGEGGNGGRGGEGCICRERYWSFRQCVTRQSCRDVESCHDVQERQSDGTYRTVRQCRTDRVCTPYEDCDTYHFTCRDGQQGRYGSNHGRNSDGNRGSIRLVQNLAVVPDEMTSTNRTLAQLTNSVTLTKQIWDNVGGARSLFAPGSNVGDRYYIYRRLAQKSFRVDWQATHDMSEFSNVGVQLNFDGSYISYSVDSDFFFKGEVVYGTNEDVLVIRSAFREDEITDLTFVKAEGVGSELKLIFQDHRDLNDVVDTKIKIKFSFQPFIGKMKNIISDEWKHELLLDSEFVTIEGDKIILHVGKYPYKRSLDKILKAKRKVAFKAVFLRKYGSKTAQKVIEQKKTRLSELTN